jgi:subtilisin-like proprotein convertase family protein
MDQGETLIIEERAISMLRRADEVVVRLDQPSAGVPDFLAPAVAEFVLDRRLDERTLVLRSTATGFASPTGPYPGRVSQGAFFAELSNVPGVTWAAPVYQNASSNTWAVALDEVIVGLEPGATPTQFTRDPRFTQVRPLAGSADLFVLTLAAGPGPAALAVAESMHAEPGVAWANPNFIQDWRKFFTPNDTLIGQQWHLNNTGQNGSVPDSDADVFEAWDVTAGGSASVTIAVVDDGMELTHPDLAPNLFVNTNEIAGDGIDNDNNGYIDDRQGWDFTTNGAIGDNNPGADSTNDAHATAVAGIAAGKGNNNLGIAGAAYNAKILPVRIFGSTGAATDDANIASATFYAAGRNKAGTANWASIDIMNHSWGGGPVSTVIQNAFTSGTVNGRGGKGTVSFISSGNGYGAVSNPAAYGSTNAGIVVVGASTDIDVRAFYSNFGPTLTLVAPSSYDTFGPGTDGFFGTVTTDRLGTAGYHEVAGAVGDYTTTADSAFGGTSSAAPLAAGIGALVLSLNANLTAVQVRDFLKATTDYIGPAAITYNRATGFNNEYGYGRINAFTAVSGVGKPEVQVLDGKLNVPNTTGSVDFGPAITVGDTVDLTLRVRNQGTLDLTLSAITLPAGPFNVVSSFSDSTLSVGESASFVVRFSPTVGGNFTQTLSFGNNDADEGAYSFTLKAIGKAPSIGGRLYDDYNGNGTFDAADPGFNAQTAYLDNNGNGTLDILPAQTYPGSAGLPLTLPDNTTKTATLAISNFTGAIADVNVKLAITHTFNSDLNVFLIAPSGQRVELFTGVGGSGKNFTNTMLDDAAATAITTGTAPFTGTFRPEGKLSDFNGLDANGTWTLEISDVASGDTGTLTAWSLDIAASEPTALTGSTGAYSFFNLNPGNYTVRATTPAGYQTSGPTNHVVTVTAGSTTTDRHLGFVPTGPNIQGRVFEDANGNGVVNATEVGRVGAKVFLDNNGNGTFDTLPAQTYPGSAGLPLTLPDNTTKTATLAISNFTGAIADVNVRLSITHTYNSDLDVFLISPSGKRVELFTDVGGSGKNFTNTMLDDAAATTITTGTAPFTGTFRPEGKLSDFNGLDANGTWTLEISDDASGDTGTLTAWSLDITASEPTAVTDALGNYRFPVTAGNYTVRVAPPIVGGATTPASGKYEVTVGTTPVLNRDFGFDATAPTVGPFTVGDTTATFPNQRSVVRTLTVTFNETIAFVGLPTSAFTVTRTGPGAPTNFVPTVNLDNTSGVGIVTLSFPGESGASLSDGNYTVTVNANQVADAKGNVQASASTFNFHRLFGDATGDRQVTNPEFFAFRAALGTAVGNPAFVGLFDFDNNGSITNADFFAFRARLGTTLP